MRELYVIIPAAGKGTRMGGDRDKLLLEIAGVPVIRRTLDIWQEFSKTHPLKCVIAAGDNMEDIKRIAIDYDITAKIVRGGSSRTMSVYNAVASLSELGADGDDIVMVHDAARCMTSQKLLNDMYDAMEKYDVCVAGVREKNTIKVTDAAGRVISTPDRSTLFAVQTPQCFTYEAIFNSYGNAIKNNIEATDDTALAEIIGYDVYVVEGDYTNIKITTADDITYAESLTRGS